MDNITYRMALALTICLFVCFFFLALTISTGIESGQMYVNISEIGD